MAKISWVVQEDLLIAKIGDVEAIFAIPEVFPTFGDLQGVPRQLVIYGLKQKLADSTAKGKDYALTAKEKAKIMHEKFDDLKRGIWARKAERKSVEDTIREAMAGLTPKEQKIAQKLLEILQKKNKK